MEDYNLNDIDDIEDIDIEDLDGEDLFSDLEDIISDETQDKDSNIEEVIEYSQGTPVNKSELLDDDNDNVKSKFTGQSVDDSDFISSSGDFVVMDNTNSENAFELKIVDIDKRIYLIIYIITVLLEQVMKSYNFVYEWCLRLTLFQYHYQ